MSSKHLSGEAFKSLEEAEAAMSIPAIAYPLDEGQRQLILMAIAHLAVERPGWDFAAGEIADVFQGREMFDRFKQYLPDLYRKPSLSE